MNLEKRMPLFESISIDKTKLTESAKDLKKKSLEEDLDDKKLNESEGLALSNEDKEMIKLVDGVKEYMEYYKEEKLDGNNPSPAEYVIGFFDMLHDDSYKSARKFYSKVSKKFPKLAERIIKEYGDNFMYD
jgi:hypothetical protein